MVLKNINVNVTGFMSGKQIINQRTTIDMRDKKAGDVVISPSIDPHDYKKNTVDVKFEPTVIENGVADKSSLDSPVNLNDIELNKDVIPAVQKNEKMTDLVCDQDEPELIESDDDEKKQKIVIANPPPQPEVVAVTNVNLIDQVEEV